MNSRITFLVCLYGLISLSHMISLCSDQDPMKILIVVPRFPKIHDICMLNQIIGLIKRGHDVTIYAPQEGDKNSMQEEIIKYDLLSKTIIGEFPRDINRFDIVMFQLGHLAFNVKKKYNFKGKVVVCIRGYDITGFIQENPHAYDKLFKTCDLFMPVCGAFKTILQKLGCPEHKIIVHHSGIDSAFFQFTKKKLKKRGLVKVVSAGRYVEKKGFEYAIRAIAELVPRYSFIRYRIVGDGPLKKKYKKLVRSLGVEDYITLDASWYAHDQYRDILNESSIFISPSITALTNDQEGIPNVTKEAMATGMIVIATDHSGIPELVENKISGFLVSERDSKALAESISYIINNYTQCVALQHAARKKIEQDFDNEKLNSTLEKIFLKLINN